jgi:hypothetical protein
MAVAKNAGHKLYGIWKKKYLERHGKEYLGSKYRDAGMLKGIAEDIGEDQVLDLMLWYFERKSIHEFTTFCWHYDRLIVERDAQRRDERYIESLRERTRKRMEELGVDL